MSDTTVKETLRCQINEPRLDQLEEGLKNVNDKLELVNTHDSEQYELLAKLDTMVEFMVEDRKNTREEAREERRLREEERREVREFNATMTKTVQNVNENLISLNSTTSGLEKRVNVLEEKDEKQHINIPVIITRGVEMLIMSGVIGGVAWLLSIYFSTK